MSIKIDYSRSNLRDGLTTQAELRETPDTFATRNSVAEQSNDKQLDAKFRAQRWRDKNVPVELQDKAIDEDRLTWLTAFSDTTYGRDFNEQRINGINPYRAVS